MAVQLLDDVMKINFKPLVACLILIGGFPTVSVYADAMQDIQGKKDDVERTLQEIEKYAALNGGNTVPDPALEGEIARVETHLNQMDFRLGSLPPCQKTPVPPGTNAAVDALKRLFIDEAEAQRQKTKVEDRIKEIRKRIDFLAIVNDAAKKLVQAKAAVWAGSLALKVIPGLGSLALSPIPGMGTAFDVMGTLESAFNNPNAPKNVRGLREYHLYLGENKDRFQSFVYAKAKETLARDPRYSFTERDIIWWAHKFVLENTPKDKQAKERESEDAQKELERHDKQIEELRKNNSYFAGLLARLQAAIDNSKWIRDPSQFERMKAEIKVTITDDNTGTEIPSANLRVAPNAGTARTAGNPYEFEEVSLGGYSLTADAPGYVPENSQVNV